MTESTAAARHAEARHDSAKAKESSTQERLEALLVSLRENARHNAPTSPSALAELEAIVALGRGGKVVVPQHDFAIAGGHRLIVGGGEKVRIVHTAEEALDYVRALPAEVRDRPHWLRAERALLTALDFGEPRALSDAAREFEAAEAEDRKLTPVEHKPLERLPDGRVREDRFADRKPRETVAPEIVAHAPAKQAPSSRSQHG